MKVDLRNVQLRAGETSVRTRVDVGNLRVIVPSNVALRIDGDAQLGQVQMLGTTADGRNVDRHVAETGKRVLVLKAHVGVGKVQVTRAVR
jgi:predicted membrane protein